MQEVRDTESGQSRWYVLSQSQDKYKSVTPILIALYEQLRKGLAPGNQTRMKFDRRCVTVYYVAKCYVM